MVSSRRAESSVALIACAACCSRAVAAAFCAATFGAENSGILIARPA